MHMQLHFEGAVTRRNQCCNSVSHILVVVVVAHLVVCFNYKSCILVWLILSVISRCCCYRKATSALDSKYNIFT
jgi:hypothetical protein